MKTRVLIVEAEGELREACGAFLADHGFSFEGVASAEEAMTLLERERFDAAIVDEGLPGLSGSDLICWLRTGGLAPALPVIGFSGRFGSERALMDAGATCCLEKPFSPDALLRTVRWVVSVYGRPAGS